MCAPHNANSKAGEERGCSQQFKLNGCNFLRIAFNTLSKLRWMWWLKSQQNENIHREGNLNSRSAGGKKLFLCWAVIKNVIRQKEPRGSGRRHKIAQRFFSNFRHTLFLQGPFKLWDWTSCVETFLQVQTAFSQKTDCLGTLPKPTCQIQRHPANRDTFHHCEPTIQEPHFLCMEPNVAAGRRRRRLNSVTQMCRAGLLQRGVVS